MKRTLIAAAAVAALFSTTAWAQMGPGMMGPGMMGPGMMGPGMMGPGMMGPGMMGPGMMGPGMMGPGMMGPGMMPGYGSYGGTNLSDEQRAKIAEIQQEVSRKQWDLMAKMHEQRHQLSKPEASGKSDEATVRKGFEAMSDAHKAMFENSLDARKRIDAVLTKEQREQLRSDSHCG